MTHTQQRNILDDTSNTFKIHLKGYLGLDIAKDYYITVCNECNGDYNVEFHGEGFANCEHCNKGYIVKTK
jgi:hypothetical protein